MKRIQFLFSLFVLFLLFGCGANSNSKNIEPPVTPKKQEIIENKYYFDEIDSLKEQVEQEKIEKNYYYLLPMYINTSMFAYRSFDFYIEKECDGKIINSKIKEHFSIIDESLGIQGDKKKDGPYITITFKCEFYYTDEDIVDITYEYVEGYSIKINLIGEKANIGYIYAYHGELDADEYVRDYISKNLKRIKI